MGNNQVPHNFSFFNFLLIFSGKSFSYIAMAVNLLSKSGSVKYDHLYFDGSYGASLSYHSFISTDKYIR